MPMLGQTQYNISGTHYGFSASHLDQLGSTEYTLVTICADVSSSVSSFIRQIEDCLASIVQTCRHAPRSDHLMLRVLTFNHKVTEVHGFKPLIECSAQDYQGQLRASGSTALYDASYNAIASIADYGEQLAVHDFDVNGIVFVITDGCDNDSKSTPQKVQHVLKQCFTNEHLESMLSVVIGVNVHDRALSTELKDFQTQVGFDEYIELDNADTNTLRTLAQFVSRSISLQSRALGSGQGAVSLSF